MKITYLSSADLDLDSDLDLYQPSVGNHADDG